MVLNKSSSSKSKSYSRSRSPVDHRRSGAYSPRSGSGRKLVHQNIFNPALDQAAYSKQNLEEFISTMPADLVAQYKQAEEQLSEQVVRNFVPNYDSLPEDQRKAARANVAKTKPDYRNARKQLAFKFLTQNQQFIGQGSVLVSQKKKTIKADDPQLLQLSGNPAQLMQWVASHQPDDFNVSALEAIVGFLKPLGLKKNESIKDLPKGLDAASNTAAKKRALHQYILSGGRREAVVQQAAVRGAVNVNELSTMTAAQLKALAKSYGVKGAQGNKANIITKIAAALGQPSGVQVALSARDLKATAQQEVQQMINQATQGASMQVQAALRSYNPDRLAAAGSVLVKQLAKALNLPVTRQTGTLDAKGKPKTAARSLADIVHQLTNQHVSKSTSRTKSLNIKGDVQQCYVASDDEVRAVADNLKVYYTPYTSKAEICDAIHQRYLEAVSSILIKQLGAEGNLDAIAALPVAQQRDRIRKLANLAQLALPEDQLTLAGLLREWLRAHYVARAMKFYPAHAQAVDQFLATGAVPADDAALTALSVVFSDVQPNIFAASPAQRAALLNAFFAEFVQRFGGDGVAALQLARQGLQNYRFGLGPTSPVRSRSPVRRSVSPSQILASTPFRQYTAPRVSPVAQVSSLSSLIGAPLARSPVRASPSRQLPAQPAQNLLDEDIFGSNILDE